MNVVKTTLSNKSIHKTMARHHPRKEKGEHRIRKRNRNRGNYVTVTEGNDRYLFLERIFKGRNRSGESHQTLFEKFYLVTNIYPFMSNLTFFLRGKELTI